MTNQKGLLVGAAEVDITPPLGTHLLGDLCRHRPADKVVDRIYAKALVLSGASTSTVCFISMDLLSVNNEHTQIIREAIESRFGIPSDAIMLHPTQNHSAPAIGLHFMFAPDNPLIGKDLWWMHGGDPTYPDFVIPKILEVVGNAVENQQPATLGVTHGMDSRIGFNRRFVKRDGTVQTLPRADDLLDISHVEGPADPEVAIACFFNQDAKPIAVLLHHTAHPCSLFSTNHITASWPGQWCRQFKEKYGDQCVPLMVNGCCGNINIDNRLDPTPTKSDAGIGEMLMETTVKAMERMRTDTTTTVDYCSLRFPIAHARTDPKEVSEARAVLEQHPGPKWMNDEHSRVDVDWAFAALLVDLDDQFSDEPEFTYEVQMFRIGEFSLVGLIGEPFAEGQLEVKRMSPASRTLVAHMCNGYIGYIPPRHCYEKFNYNFYAPDGRPVRRGATRYLLAAEAWEKITKKCEEAFATLFPAVDDADENSVTK